MSRGLFVAFLTIPILALPVRAAEPSFADRPLQEWIADLAEKDPLIREEAIEVLIKIGPEARIALPRLAEMHEKDPSAGVRRRAALALWRLDGQTKPARDVLTADLKSPIPAQRLKAVSLLRELGTPAAELTPTVLDMIADVDVFVKDQAATALNLLGEDAVPAVIAA